MYCMFCTDASDSTVSKPKASSGRVGGNKPSHSSQSRGYSGTNGQENKRSDSDFYSRLAAQGNEDDSDDEAVRGSLNRATCVCVCT